jgi:hypothetical protein
LDQLAHENDILTMNEVSYDVPLEKMHEWIYPKHGSRWWRGLREDSSPIVDTLHWQQQETARCQTKTNKVLVKVNLKCQKKCEQIDPTWIFITMYQIHYNHLQ